MTFEVGVLAAGGAAVAAVAAPVGFGIALGRAQPELRATWLRRTNLIVLGAAALLLVAFLAVAVADLFGGDKRDALFGTTSGAFRFALALFVFSVLAPVVLLVGGYLIAMVRLFALASAAEPPSDRTSSNAGLASWPVFAVLIGLPLAAIVYDGGFSIENFASLARHVSRDGLGLLVMDALFLVVAVVSAVLVRRGRGGVAAALLGASVLGWPVVVVLRASGSVTEDALLRTGAWYLVMLLAVALSMILGRTAKQRSPDARMAAGWGYVVGLMILVIGVGSAAAWLITLDARRPPAPTVAKVITLPGSDQVTLDARPYVLYLTDNTGTRDLESGIQVTGPAGAVSVERYESTGPTWGLGEQGWTAYSGTPFATIEPPVAGTHQIDARIPPSWRFGLQEPLRIAVGDPPPPTPRWAIWSAELLAALATITGVMMIAVTALRRHLPARPHESRLIGG